MITTDDAALAERCRVLRSHGSTRKHEHSAIGGNFRLDALQAALLRVKLPRLETWIAARREHAEAYAAAFQGIPGLSAPRLPPGVAGSWAQYTLRVGQGRRDALAAALAARGIETAVHYPRPLHLQPALASLKLGPGSFPEAERAASEVLSIPVHAGLTTEERSHVIAAVQAFFG
jgi:dTDP-4-amino-4,6-dideoxygalactose transaminase